MRVSVSAAEKAPAFPKLMRYRQLNDDHIVLMSDDREGTVVVSGIWNQPVGHFRNDWSMNLWEPFDGAVTLQN